jgi:hypothetical protein
MVNKAADIFLLSASQRVASPLLIAEVGRLTSAGLWRPTVNKFIAEGKKTVDGIHPARFIWA